MAGTYQREQTAPLYRKWRSYDAGYHARSALLYARYELAQFQMLARFGSWQWANRGYGTFAYADYESWSWGELADTDDNGPLTVRVMVGDDDNGVDSDLVLTDEERKHASTYYIALVVIDHDGVEFYHDGIGGVVVIDLDGFLQRDWEDAVAYALIEYLELDKALRIATTETTERAYWAARDVITI